MLTMEMYWKGTAERLRLPVMAATLAVAALAVAGCVGTRNEPAMSEPQPRDLTPVTRLETPNHAPVEIVRDGKARAIVWVADSKARKEVDPELYRRKNAGTPPALARLVQEMVEVIGIGTGATLERPDERPPADRPAIIIGDCAESRLAGIDTNGLPSEGFVVKTAANRVFLVGRTPAGTTWAVADFLERLAGVRWYWRMEYGGRSVPHQATLVIPPVHYRDEPVFRHRFHYIDIPYLYPVHTEGHNSGDLMPLPFAAGVAPDGDAPDPMAGWSAAKGSSTRLSAPLSGYTPDLPLIRHGSSLDFQAGLIQGYAGMWGGLGALNEDGTRHAQWVCYSAPETLDAYVAKLKEHWNVQGPVRGADHNLMTESSCTVYFPNSPGMVCHCPLCRKAAARYSDDREMYATLVGQYGERRAFEIVEERVHIRVFGLFVRRLCEVVKERWPDKKVVFRSGELPPPEEVMFPDNFRVYAVWPGTWWSLGLEMHPSTGRTFENRIRAWGVPVVTEGSVSSPSDWTYGPVEYPHLVQDFHRRNRDAVCGSILTIFCPKIWISSAPTYYIWQRALWNPDLDVDATLDEMCRRLFGPGAAAARELLRLQCDRWEKTPLSRPLAAEDRHRDQSPGGRGTGTLAQEFRLPDDLFREIWPPDVVARMKALREQALAAIEKAGDVSARKAFLYWTWTFDAFLEEAEVAHRRLPAAAGGDSESTPLESADRLSAALSLDLGGGVHLKAALIRSGEFLMGSATNSWGHHRNEAPPHRVRITKPFYMSIHEVTVAQYESVMGVAHEGQKKGEGVGNVAPGPANQPVDRVSWSDATDFCRKLGAKTGRSIRLPTEAEWEYACRAGSSTLWSFGDDVNELNQYAWYDAEGKSGLQNVGGKKPNAWGLYDMHGNVREWCRDRFCADYYAWGPTDNPPGPATGIFRVLRGGSAGNLLAGRNAELARSARRAYGHPDIRHMEVGFRVAVEIADGQ